MIKLKQLGYIFSYFTNAKFLGRKSPILGGIKITHHCNLKCRQCPYWQRHKEQLTFQQCIEIMDTMYQDGVRLLIFEGGEPFLWQDGEYNIHDLVSEAKKRFFNVGITTNGTFPLDIDTDVVWVSIDGLRKTHNFLRSNSYDALMKNVQTSSHKNLFANITFNKYNYNQVTELVKAISSFFKGITIQFFFPYDESDKSLMLSWEERKKVLLELIELKKAGFPIADSYTALDALIDNKWSCKPWMLANADPDGQINHGCYLLNRSTKNDPCAVCGFAAHTEISLAYNLHIDAVLAGRKILNIF